MLASSITQCVLVAALSPIHLSAQDVGPEPKVPAQKQHALFGSLIVSLGDVDGDQRGDCLVADPGLGVADAQASIFVLSPAQSRVVASLKVREKSGIDGPFVCAGTRDQNGDGVNDFMLAGRDASAPRVAVVAHSGRDGARLWRRLCDPVVKKCFAIGTIQDLDRDGLADYALACAVEDAGVVRTALKLHSSTTGRELSAILLPEALGAALGALIVVPATGAEGEESLVVTAGVQETAECQAVVCSTKTASIRWELRGWPKAVQNHIGCAPAMDLVAGEQVLAFGVNSTIQFLSTKDGSSKGQLVGEPHIAFGASLASIRDSKRGQVRRLAVAAPNWGVAEGRVGIYDSKETDQPPEVILGGGDAWHFGAVLVEIQDVDGDSWSDLAIAGDHDLSWAPGLVAIVSGRTGTVLARFTRKDGEVRKS